MLLFTGELLEVQKGEYNSLVFKSEKYDMGLKIKVPCSQSIGISQECMIFLSNYEKHVGQNVAVPVTPLKTKKGGIFLLTEGDVVVGETKNKA